MTAGQITQVLSEIGYSMNMDIPLSEIRYIYLTTDGCLYPGTDIRFNFHKINDGGVLMLYKGHTDSSGNFIKKLSTPVSFIDFSIISGFVMNQEVR